MHIMACQFPTVTLTPLQVDKVCTDLQTAVRVEKSTKKIRKIEPDFYRSVTEVLRTLRAELESSVTSDRDRYDELKERIRQVESQFEQFFKLRFAKLLLLSLHEVKAEEWGQLTTEERSFLQNQQKTMADLFRRYRDVSAEVAPEPVVLERKTEKREETPEAPSSSEEEFVLVRILSDLPPIAQDERDYYLRSNDVVHLKNEFASMLISRGWAKKINLSV